MNTYRVATAAGTTEVVTADRAVEEDNRVKFFDGDEQVASFVGASSWSKFEPQSGELGVNYGTDTPPADQ